MHPKLTMIDYFGIRVTVPVRARIASIEIANISQPSISYSPREGANCIRRSCIQQQYGRVVTVPVRARIASMIRLQKLMKPKKLQSP